MTTARTLFPNLTYTPRPSVGSRAVAPTPLQRLRALWAGLSNCFQSYDDYFAEIERSLPERVRDQRQQQRQARRVLLIAALCR